MCLQGPDHPPIDFAIDEYQHGIIDRRQFLARATALIGAGAASALVAACAPGQQAAAPKAALTEAPKAAAPTAAPPPAPTAVPPTAAPTAAPPTAVPPTAAPKATEAPKAAAPAVPAYGTVPADASDITTENVSFKSGDADIKGYLARPKTGGPFPGVIVIHENRGITPHEQDMARRFARAGFVAIALDLLSRQGGSDKFPTQQEKTAAIGQVKEDESIADMAAAVKYLKGLDSVKGGKVGITGYCWGGGRSNLAAINIPEIAAAAPYYGPAPQNLDNLKNSNAALLLVYAGNDQRINAGIPAYEAKLKELNKTYQIKMYDGAGHAFNNDTGPNFNAAAAKDAWEQTVAWFNKYLRG